MQDLLLLKGLVEQYLADNNYADAPLILQTAFDALKNYSQEEALAICGGKVYVAAEDLPTMPALTRQFIMKAMELTGGNVVALCASNVPTVKAILDTKQITPAFFAGYGYTNEIRHVIDTMKKEQYAPGDVAVVYMNDAQLPYIRAELGAAGIPTDYVSGLPAGSNAVVALLHAILDWADDDFSETALEKVLRSRVFEAWYEYEEDNEKTGKNALGWYGYFNHVVKAANRYATDTEQPHKLGWGYDWNKRFVTDEKALAETADDKGRLAALVLHEDILNVFGGVDDKNKKWSAAALFGALLDCLDTHVNKHCGKNKDKKPMDYTVIRKSVLEGVRQDLDALPEMSFKEAAAAIHAALEQAALPDVTDPEVCTRLIVQKMTSRFCVNRKHLFIIGLSLRDFAGAASESPVMTDEEMDAWLESGNETALPTSAAKQEQRKTTLLESLTISDFETITLGYAYYDTVGHTACNPAPLFAQTANACGVSIDKVPKAVFSLPSQPAACMIEANAPQNAGNTAIVAAVDEDEFNYDDSVEMPEDEKPAANPFKTDKTLSPSALEIMANCPRAYAYEKLAYLPDNERTEPDYREWLNNMDKGTAFHSIMEKYVVGQMIGKDLTVADAPKEDALQDIICDVLQTYEKIVPKACDRAYEATKEALWEMSLSYLKDFYAELNVWQPLACEFAFGKREEPQDGEQKDDGVPVKIPGIQKKIDEKSKNDTKKEEEKDTSKFWGSVDRIDYKRTEDGNVVLRVIDYKTGKYDSKNKEWNAGKLVQPYIYIAILDDAKVKAEILKLLELRGEKVTTYTAESFNYVFPVEETNRVLNIAAGETAYKLSRLVAGFNALADATDMIPNLGQLQYAEKDEWTNEEKCTYCKYRELCLDRKENFTDER